jgi:hypothetical protein
MASNRQVRALETARQDGVDLLSALAELGEALGRSGAEHIGRTVEDVVPTLWSELAPLCQRVLVTGNVILNTEVTGTPWPGRRSSANTTSATHAAQRHL